LPSTIRAQPAANARYNYFPDPPLRPIIFFCELPSRPSSLHFFYLVGPRSGCGDNLFTHLFFFVFPPSRTARSLSSFTIPLFLRRPAAVDRVDARADQVFFPRSRFFPLFSFPYAGSFFSGTPFPVVALPNHRTHGCSDGDLPGPFLFLLPVLAHLPLFLSGHAIAASEFHAEGLRSRKTVRVSP